MNIIEKAVGKLESKKGTEADSLVNEESQVKAALEHVEHLEEGVANASVTEGAEDTLAAIEPDEGNGHGRIESEPEQKRLHLTVPLAQFKERGMITVDSPRNKIAEEYRRIKRPLLMNIEGEGAALIKNPNLIMVTSSLPGEGKTFSAINLAMSIAMEQDKTVLFVDADVAKATAGSLFGVPRDSRGLIDVLEKGVKLRDVLYQTNVPNLRILPAGKVHERSTELLASEGMRKLMADLSRRYSDRVIVFDSPPLLPTTEANVLANLMGQIVFVVAAGQTSQGAVTESLSHIEGDKVIGLVLNKSTAKFGVSYGYGYSYDYGYGYGYGYGSEDRRQEANGG